MSTPIDPASLGSWEEAFAHPIPAVRQLERQVRADLAKNKTQLRGLVGESYRELLQTAERIIAMDEQAGRIEGNLASLSQNCRAAVLDRKAANLRVFHERQSATDAARYGYGAQLAVLAACPSVVSRLLHDREQCCLLAAKVFVVSRLLLKSLQEAKENESEFLESLKRQLTMLRGVLLQQVDAVLAETDKVERLVPALTAFSLLKTASPAEMLRHFLHIRTAAMASVLSSPTAEMVLAALVLFNRTLVDAQELFPQKLSEVLQALKSHPLLQDADILAVPELDLDVNGRWLPAEIQGYIPWVRHDDLERSKATESIGAWATRETETLNTALEKELSALPTVAEVVQLRTGALGLWRAGRKVRTRFTGATSGDRFRELVNVRLAAIAKSEAAGLEQAGEALNTILSSFRDPLSTTSIWDTALLSIPLSKGALQFREAVAARVHGKDAAVSEFLGVYSAWLSKIDTSATGMRQLRTADAPVEGDEEDFDAEEERVAEGLEDSEAAEKELTAALEDAYRGLEKRLSEIVDECTSDKGEPPKERASDTTADATFLLRCIRQLRLAPPKRGDAVLLPLAWFGLQLFPKLHLAIATGVSTQPLATLEAMLRKRQWEKAGPARLLWEGSPPLPVQPSPVVFRTLHELVTEMGKAGEDVWTPAASNGVKAMVVEQMWAALDKVLEGRELKDLEKEEQSQKAEENGENAEAEQSNDGAEDAPAPATPAEKLEDGTPASPEKSTTNGAEEATEPPEPQNGSPPPEGNGNAAEPPANPTPSQTPQNPTNGRRSSGTLLSEPTPAADPPPAKCISPLWALQLLFDALYLDEALHQRGKKSLSYTIPTFTLAGRVDAAVGSKLELDEGMRIRLEGAASEYWKRTQLLFAWLA